MSTTGRRTGLDESTEDAPTVRADGERLRRVLEEDAEDARTVRMRRLPVAFIGESVIDPATRVDGRPAARRWRAEGNVDEIDPLAEPPSLDPPPRLVAPEATPAEPADPARLDDEPSLAAMLLALAVGVALGAVVVGGIALLVT